MMVRWPALRLRTWLAPYGRRALSSSASSHQPRARHQWLAQRNRSDHLVDPRRIGIESVEPGQARRGRTLHCLNNVIRRWTAGAL